MENEIEQTKSAPRNPMREFSHLQREFNRLFDTLPWPTHATAAIADAIAISPACDVEETEKEYRMTFDMPGIPQEKIKVEINDCELVVSGERKEEYKEDCKSKHLVERYQGQFKRVFALPKNANADQILANYENGVLKISIPKNQATKTKQIKITEAKTIGASKPPSNKLS